MEELIYDPPRAPRLSTMPTLRAMRPASTEEVRQCVAEAESEKLRLRPMGGGRHSRGLPTDPTTTVLDMRGLQGVLGWDPLSLLVHVEAGITIRKLTDYLSRRSASLAVWRREHPTATVGGLLSAYQPIPRALWNGSIREACLGLTCVTPSGEEYGYVPAPRKAAGPDLRYLFIGGEGRFGAITEAWLGVGPAPEIAKFYAVALPSPAAAMGFIAGCWSTGFRLPNALYSGAGGMLWLLLEGSRDFVNIMEGILLDLAQKASASLLPRDPEDYYEPWTGDLRAGADPASDRPEDEEGGVAIWGNLAELAALPDEVWDLAVVYDISPHQASVWLPASRAAKLEFFSAHDALGERVFWFDGQSLAPTSRGGDNAIDRAIAAAMDPRSRFGHGGSQ
jgi:FAD/FMN-containing dehydrogenase